MRQETDSLGQLFLPEDVYYGIQTERALQNFSISGNLLDHHPRLLWCVAAIKKAAALANRDIGALEPEIAEAICEAADEIMRGEMAGHFPVDIYQGGGATSINMNVNEVIANRANERLTGSKGYERVHPNTHVNMGQSTNDVIPSALKMACYFHVHELLKGLEVLEEAVRLKAEEFANVVTVARTCLQDALPVTLGQEFGGYLAFIQRQAREIKGVSGICLTIPLGATAVGTGIGSYPGYLEKIYEYLPAVAGAPLRKDDNFFDALQSGDAYIRISGALKGLATGLSKMANDLRLLSSGPRAGLSEIELPAVQPGSSIMPGKVNPVIPEMIIQVSYRVCGNDLSITMAVEGGELNLNVWDPLIINCLFESFRLLTNSIALFADKCVRGIVANEKICKSHAEASLALATVLSTICGYDKASAVAKRAHAEGLSIGEAAVRMGIISAEEATEFLDPVFLTSYEKYREVLEKIMKRSPDPA